MVSEGRWVKIALVAAIAIVIGSTMMVTSYRGHAGAADLEQPSEQCTAVTTTTAC
jgi:hypothetical protein